MPFPVRRVLLGFLAGTAAGWAAGLLRTPSAARPNGAATGWSSLPQREFGDPAGDPAGGLPPGAQEPLPDVTEPADRRGAGG